MSNTLTHGELAEVPFGKLVPNPDNIRQDLGDIETLAASIKGSGLHTPLKVRAQEDGTFVILAGHRRHAALAELGTKDTATVPALVVTSNGEEDPTVMLVENLMREGINPLEEAKGIQMLLDFGLNQKAISERTGISKATVSNRAALARLPERFAPDFLAGYLPMEQALELVKVVQHIPEEVQAEITEAQPSVMGTKPYRDLIARTNRRLTVERGRKQAEDLGIEVFTSESDVPLPEGKVLVWVEGYDKAGKIPQSVKQVIVTAGPDGEPRFRPVKFADADDAKAASDPDKERRQAERQYKADRLEFWQGVVGGRPKQADLADSIAEGFFQLLPKDAWRIACRILEIANDDCPDDDFGNPDHRTAVLERIAEGGVTGNRATLATIGGLVEAHSRHDHQPDWAASITQSWAS